MGGAENKTEANTKLRAPREQQRRAGRAGRGPSFAIGYGDRPKLGREILIWVGVLSATEPRVPTGWRWRGLHPTKKPPRNP
jgi:hypothetical protein